MIQRYTKGNLQTWTPSHESTGYSGKMPFKDPELFSENLSTTDRPHRPHMLLPQGAAHCDGVSLAVPVTDLHILHVIVIAICCRWMTVEELAEEVMAPRLHMASFALQLENLQDDPFVPWRFTC